MPIRLFGLPVVAYVYCLSHAFEPRFKIGKALNLSRRLRQLSRDHIDIGTSLIFAVPSEQEAFNLESILHRVFSSARLAPLGTFDGATEWFSAEAKLRLVQFVVNNQAELGCQVFSAATVLAAEATGLVTNGHQVVFVPKHLAFAEKNKVTAHKLKNIWIQSAFSLDDEGQVALRNGSLKLRAKLENMRFIDANGNKHAVFKDVAGKADGSLTLTVNVPLFEELMGVSVRVPDEFVDWCQENLVARLVE